MDKREIIATELFDLNDPEGARAYLRMWVESEQLSLDGIGAKTVDELSDDSAIDIAKQVFLKADTRPTPKEMQ